MVGNHSDDVSEWSGPDVCTGEIYPPFTLPAQELAFDQWLGVMWVSGGGKQFILWIIFCIFEYR